MILTENLGTLSLGDLITDVGNKRLSNIQRKNYGRILSASAFVGSAGAAADSAIEWSEDQTSIIKMYNPTTDSVINRDVSIGLEGYIASKHRLDLEAIDGFSNDCYMMASFLEQRAGESLVGKIQGSEVTLFESLGTFGAEDALIEKTKTLANHEIDEQNDRFVSWCTLLGSSALWDAQVELTVSGDFRGSLNNCVSTTKALRHNSWLPAQIYIPKGAAFGINGLNAAAAEAKIGLKILKLTDSPMAAGIEAAKPDEV